MTKNTELLSFRNEIDKIDDDIMQLLCKRFSIINQVGLYKKNNCIDAFLKDRVEEVVTRNVIAASKYNIPQDLVENIYRQIIDASIEIEEEIIKNK